MRNMKFSALLELLKPDEAVSITPDSGCFTGAVAFVVFENLQEGSPEFGNKTVLPVGVGYKYATVPELEGAWLGEEPNHRTAVAFAINPSSFTT